MNLFKRSSAGLFASQSLTGHLLRGAIALLLLIWSVQHQTQVPLSLLTAVGALIALRGCPVCWTIGLLETIVQKYRRSV